VQNILSFESCVCDWEIGGTVEIEGTRKDESNKKEGWEGGRVG
jgi:hypothetical protein